MFSGRRYPIRLTIMPNQEGEWTNHKTNMHVKKAIEGCGCSIIALARVNTFSWSQIHHPYCYGYQSYHNEKKTCPSLSPYDDHGHHHGGSSCSIIAVGGAHTI